jgi:spore germination protein KA
LVEEAVIDQNKSNKIISRIKQQLIVNGSIKESNKMDEIVYELLRGNTIIFINKIDISLIIESRKLEKRSIEKPENEVMLLGSKDAFTEDIETNCSMLLKRLPIPELRFEAFTIGKRSRTKVKLTWIEGIADPKIVEEARMRIKRIDIDVVSGIGVLAELIEENPLSIFSKYRQTERPDMASKYLADGYIVVTCDCSPFALIMPILFWDNFKSVDDYEDRTVFSTSIRILRHIAFVIAVIICPLYLSFVTYNHTIVPPTLALSIAAAREGVPFPSVVEVLLMNLFTDILRESGIRMPGVGGYSIGTLGAVVIGQAAVAAGIVSSSVIIVVAISSIAVFAISISSFVNTSRILNYIFILSSAVLGIVGLINAVIFVIWHAISLRSLGIPYLYPVIPFDWEGFKDTFTRPKLGVLTKRTKLLAPLNRVRMGNKK